MLLGKLLGSVRTYFELLMGLNFMWLRYLLFLALFLPIQVLAQTYLCVAEAGAGIEKDGPDSFTPRIFDVSNKKYIQEKRQEGWVVKELGSDMIIFDDCDGYSHCESSEGYVGVFRRGADNTFTIMWFTGDGSGTLTTALAEGRCSKVQ